MQIVLPGGNAAVQFARGIPTGRFFASGRNISPPCAFSYGEVMSDANRANNEREQLTGWVRRHGGAVLGYLTGIVRDRSLAEDLLQEVFCRAWQARQRYRDAGCERAYLLRIADRLACDRARRRKREPAVSGDRPEAAELAARECPPWERMALAETRQMLAAALDSLSEPQRRTLLLRYYGNLDFNQIADTLGAPLNTVLSHNRRGLAALRQLLAEKNQ